MGVCDKEELGGKGVMNTWPVPGEVFIGVHTGNTYICVEWGQFLVINNISPKGELRLTRWSESMALRKI